MAQCGVIPLWRPLTEARQTSKRSIASPGKSALGTERRESRFPRESRRARQKVRSPGLDQRPIIHATCHAWPIHDIWQLNPWSLVDCLAVVGQAKSKSQGEVRVGSPGEENLTRVYASLKAD